MFILIHGHADLNGQSLTTGAAIVQEVADEIQNNGSARHDYIPLFSLAGLLNLIAVLPHETSESVYCILSGCKKMNRQ